MRIRNKIYTCNLLFISLLFVGFNAIANSYYLDNGIKVDANLSSNFSYDDNILKSSSYKVDSEIIRLTPDISLSINPDNDKFRLSYKLQKGLYLNSHEDDYLDQYLTSYNEFNFGIRHQLRLELSYIRGHEARGTGISAGTSELNSSINEPVFYSQYNIKPRYTFGARDAKGKIEFWSGYTNKKFLNFRTLSGSLESDSTKYDDYESFSLGGEFLYKILPSTYLTVSAEQVINDYRLEPINSTSSDNHTKLAYMGLQWQITGKTDGYLKLGVQDKDFDDKNRVDFTGMSYLIGTRWNPVSYSTFDLSASQIAKDPEQDGDYLKQKYLSLNWKHEWSYHYFTTLGGKYTKDEYVGSFKDGVLREENLISLSLGFGYKVTEDLTFNLNNRINDKKSSWDNYGYDQSVWSLNAKLDF